MSAWRCVQSSSLSRADRDRLARSLERTLEIASQPAEAVRARTAPVVSARVPLRVREVRASADDIEALVRRLRDGDAIDAQGVAMTRRLLNGGASPLF